MLGLGLGVNRNTYKKESGPILIAECDTVDDFDYIYGCAKALDTGKKESGTGSIELTKNGDAEGFFVADVTGDLNLSALTTFKYRFYVADKSNIATVGAVLFTTAGKSYDESYRYYVGWQIQNGWNTFEIALADFDKYGSGSLAGIKAVRMLVSITVDNETEVVNFDRIECL